MSVAELRSTGAAEKIPTADELIARARALAPKLRERAVKAERDREVPQESVEEYLEFRADPRAAAEALGRLRARP